MTSPALVLASIKWWNAKRPAQWTTELHLAQPCVNCRGMEEFSLALAVAELVRMRQNKS